jgi:hypothetical protein
MNIEYPKPLNCESKDGMWRAEFDKNDLLRFVQNTDVSSFIVHDAQGNPAPIRISPIRRFFVERDSGGEGTSPT